MTTDTPKSRAAPDVIRLNINVNPEIAEIIRAMAAPDRDGSATEVIRKAVSVFSYLNAQQRQGRRIFTVSIGRRGAIRNVRELTLSS